MQASYQIDMQKWRELSLLERLGNIASEVGRALAAKKRGDVPNMQAAFYRGLDLFDATARLETNSHRLREILRGREEFARVIQNDTDDNSLEMHYMNYAIAARSKL